jgi:hypothetical protein
MFLTEEQARERLKSEKNLANRFNKLSGQVRATRNLPDAPILSDSDPDSQAPILSDSQNERATQLSSPQSESPILSDNENSVSLTEKVIPLPGKNRINLTRDERTEIAIATRTGTETQASVARLFGVTPVEVNKIHNQKIQGIDEERVTAITNEVRDRALDRLMASLGLLTDDKISGCSAKDLSVIASNMGRVVEKITPKIEAPDNINFIIYSPELKQERAFKTIEI